MDYSIHRLRFGDWQPSVIRAIAADPFSTNVAVGREDGDIEICDSSNKWYTQTVLPGSTDFKLQSLVWSSVFSERGRLFGVSLRGFIFEVRDTSRRLYLARNVTNVTSVLIIILTNSLIWLH
jgi:hypothetical protein